MADVKISALPASTTPLAGTEVLPIVQGTTTKQVTVSDLTAGKFVTASSLSIGNTTDPGATNLSVTGSATIQGLTVGKGGGTVASNTTVGYQSLLSNSTGSTCTAIGYQAGYSNTTGTSNTALGASALATNLTSTNNTAVGYLSLNSLVGSGGSGSATALGYFSGSTSTDGRNSLFIGANAQPSAAADVNTLVIGTLNTTGKGSGTGFINAASGSIYQGNNSTLWAITSDERIKKNIVNNNTGLDIINQIQVRNFEYRLPEEITKVPQDQAIKKTGVQLGVIAQELAQVLPECVKTESTGVMTVNADNLTWYLINALKELNKKFDVYVASHP
jgi:hypothetical protein